MTVASGDRSVSVSGDVRSSVIVTGDNVTLNVSLDAVEGALLDRLADIRQPVPLPMPLDSRPRRFPNHVDRDVVAQAVLAEAAAAGATNLYGEPGIGKSHVLAHAAHLPEAAARDGVAYVPAEEAPLDDVLQALFEEFYDCGSPPIRPSRSRLRRELRDPQALVVVDGLELGPEEARAVLEAAPGCTFLVASTERRLRDGATVRLAGLELRDALELVEQELGRPLTSAERPDAERLCEALAGHPWRIREATARARDEGRSFAEAARTLDPADMLDALTSGERSVLAGLAAAGGGPVGLAHLRELSAVEDVEPVLADLERRHLVHSHSPSYSLAGPLQEEIEARWDLEKQREHALAHYTGWSERHRGEPAVAEERPALLGLLRWAAGTGRAEETIRLGRAVDPALAASGRFGSWGETVDVVLGAARRSGDEAVEAWALHQRGTWKACLVGGEPGLADLEAARELRERLGDRAGEAATRHNIEVVRGFGGGGGDGGDGGGAGGGGHGPAFFAAFAVLGAIVVALGLVGGLLAYDRLSEEPAVTTTTTPDGTVLISVPAVVGDDVEDALTVLEDAGLAATVAEEFSDEDAGTVIRQDPAEGTEVEGGTIVALTVSRGPELFAVPDVVGLSEQDALAALVEAGLQGSVADRAASEDFAAGLVSAQDPAAGTELESGSPVSLIVSTGPTPDLAIRIDEVVDDCSGGSCVTRITVTVANLSEGLVPVPFDVTVAAEGSEPVTVQVDGLEPREVRKLTVESAGSCFDPDCFATAEVDSGGAVEETNEENNRAEFSVVG